MSTDLMNISAFKGLAPSQAFKVLDPQSESLADGIGQSYGIIGYKGKVWTLRLRGETYQFNRPDDGSPAAFLDVIILRQLPNKSKSYYPAGSFVDGNVGQRPVCSALDGTTPDADVATPQSTACATCPRNVFKVSPDGRKTRECSDYKRLAVLVLPSLTRPLLGAALMEPVFLRVPAASLNDLAMLGEGMSAQGFHYSSYITRIGFNPEKPHPQMTFRALMALTDKEAPLVLPLREDPISIRITGEGEVNKPRPAAIQHTPAQPAQATASAQVQQQPQTNVVQMQQPKQPVQQAQPQQQAPIDTGFGEMTGALPVGTAAQQTAQPAQATAQVDTGFDTIDQPSPQQANAAQTVNTAADTGIAEDADGDLDARVAALLQR